MNNEEEQLKEVRQIGRRDWNTKLVEFFMTNHRLVVLLAVAMLIGGTFSLTTLRLEGFPQVPLKMLMVQTVYSAAGAEEVERQITKPLEDAVKEINDIKEVQNNG